MKPLEFIARQAALTQRRIALSEGEDPRVVGAALEARRLGLARIVLIGPRPQIEAELARQGAGMQDDDGLRIEDPANSALIGELAALYQRLRAHKGIGADEARQAAARPHVFAALMVRANLADGTLGGARLATAEIVRTALQVIGTAPDAKLVSSYFLMLFCQQHHPKKGAVIFSDAGLVIDPDAESLSEIALASARSYRALTRDEPRVAMLSFSTHGSAQHQAVSKVVEATDTVRRKAPDLLVEGELQFDAAFVPEVAHSKAATSPLGGNANVFVFPNLDAGNIGYKIAQRVGGALAIGPILQGLAQPANDLSRGCSSEDVLHMIAVTAAQAG